MELNIYFKSVDPSKGYVATVTPLEYTAVKKDAFKERMDFEAFDADDVEKRVWTHIDKLIDQSGVMDWCIKIETDEEEVYATVMTDSAKVAMAMADACPMGTARGIRECCSILSEYLMSKALEMSMKSIAASIAPSATAATTEPPKPSEDSADIDELVKRIEAKTKASIVKPKETLDDYVCDASLKEELEEIKNFFENKSAYVSAGIKLPKGILFKGVPGTGKTYAARCIAGSVDCFFMSCTASSLQGMYIGSGAENIKQMFEGAKALHEASKKGVIVFIDELDSFGSRANHNSSSSGEEDRTLNQLLAEMSGFEDTDGIMVLGATNYPERIDDALMRSGRFSRQITINVPDELERLELVKYYFKKLKLNYDEDCDEGTVAALTTGLTPADIAEITNEAGILTVRAKSDTVTLAQVNEAINKVITKNIRKPDKSTEFHELVAIHEAGHVLAEFFYKDEFSVKVTNYSYGDAGGFTQPRYTKDGIISKEAYKDNVMTLLGGRAAEEVLLKQISTGASEDFARALRQIKAYYEVYHFEPYEVEKISQLAEDTLRGWYSECVLTFSSPDCKDKLTRLANAIISERVLYTKDIASILTI